MVYPRLIHWFSVLQIFTLLSSWFEGYFVTHVMLLLDDLRVRCSSIIDVRLYAIEFVHICMMMPLDVTGCVMMLYGDFGFRYILWYSTIDALLLCCSVYHICMSMLFWDYSDLWWYLVIWCIGHICWLCYEMDSMLWVFTLFPFFTLSMNVSDVNGLIS